MYSRLLGTVNGTILALTLVSAGPPPQPPAAVEFLMDGATCDPRLAVLFTPPHPQLGRYNVCTRPEPLDSLRPPGWTAEATSPLDAFGSAGSYDRAALARLFGGSRPVVARAWIQADGQFESVTLISPYPDPTLTHLEPGTLIIRFIICCT